MRKISDKAGKIRTMSTHIYIVTADHERLNAGKSDPYITNGPFDASKLTISNPVIKDGTHVSQCCSPIYYMHEGVEKCTRIMMPDTTCYGINSGYKYGTRDKNTDNIEGAKFANNYKGV